MAVDLADRDAWLAEAGGVNLVNGNSYGIGDANLDGFVDGLDFIEWNANKFTQQGPILPSGVNDNGESGEVGGQPSLLRPTNPLG